jgi:membrane protease YdiL (CAAX protease family)
MTLTMFASHLSEWLGVIAVLMILQRTGSLKIRPTLFQYPQREKWAALGVYALALAIAVMVYRLPFTPAVIPGLSASPGLEKQAFLALLCLLPAIVALLYRKQPLLSAGWGRRTALNMGLRVGLMLVFLTIFLRGKIYSLLGGLTAAEGMALLALVILSLAEETLFRGFLQLRLCSWLGDRYGWLITALLFLIWQVPRLLLNPAEFWLNLGMRAIQSLLAGWIMLKCNHVLAPALYRSVSDWLSLI